MIRREGFVTGFSMALGAAVLALFLLIGWRFLGAVAEILTPFLVGTVLALLLNPVVTKVQSRYTGGKRGKAVGIVFGGFLLVFIGLVAYLVPTVIGQTGKLIRFFAPLSYRVEQRVPGSAPKVVADNLSSTNYTVDNLQNGKNYTFRIVAVDADGREYRLRPVRVAPNARQVVVSESNAGGKSGAASTDTASETNTSTPTPTASATATPVPAPSTEPSITPSTEAAGERRPSPRPTVSARDVALLPRPSVLPSGTPTPQATPTPEIDDFPSDEFGDTDGARDADAEPTPSPSVSSRSIPLLVPGTPGSESGFRRTGSAEPVPSPSATAMPRPEVSATPSPIPSAATTPTPTPSATPTPKTIVASLAQNGQKVPQSGDDNRVLRLLETTDPTPVKAGTTTATPSNGKVRLTWRPPSNVQSGFERLRAKADAWLSGHRKIGFVKLPGSIAGLQSQYADQVSAWVQDFAKRLASTIIGSLGILITIVLIPLVTFYVLNDLDRLRGRLLFFLPERARAEFVRVTADIGDVFGNYIRGMATVSAVYGVVNFVVFLALGLWFQHGLASYAILLGFIAGLLYAVPYIGPTTTTLLAGIIAAATGHEVWQTITIVVLALVINQVFDNVIVPRLVGKSVGLHPMITLFALLLGGNLFGLWGMLLSVPVAASVQLILFRLFPRLNAPTPIAYLMGEKKPQSDGGSGTSAKPSYRDLLKTPDSVTQDKPSQMQADKTVDDKTDATGNEPLGPVPTFRPPVSGASEKPANVAPAPVETAAKTETASDTPTEKPNLERPKP